MSTRQTATRTAVTKLTYDRAKNLFKKCVGKKRGAAGKLRARIFWLGPVQHEAIQKAKIYADVWAEVVDNELEGWTPEFEQEAERRIKGAERWAKMVAEVAAGRIDTTLTTADRMRRMGTFVRETQFNTRWLASHDSYNKGTRGGFSDPYGDQSYSSDTTPPELIASMAQTSEVLFVDDVGKVKPTEAWQRAMFEVIYHRHERRLPTVFSTNYSPDTMIQRMDAATNDRLWSGVVILLDGISVRHERRLVVGSS